MWNIFYLRFQRTSIVAIINYFTMLDTCKDKRDINNWKNLKDYCNVTIFYKKKVNYSVEEKLMILVTMLPAATLTLKYKKSFFALYYIWTGNIKIAWTPSHLIVMTFCDLNRFQNINPKAWAVLIFKWHVGLT